jgi:hypothetical protein
MHRVTNPISRFGFGTLLGLSLHLVTHPNGHFGFGTFCMRGAARGDRAGGSAREPTPARLVSSVVDERRQ